MVRAVVLSLGILAIAAPLSAQHAHNPYAHRATAEGTVLTADEIAGLRAGEGMSQALPAELNGYPGPRHVLELADPLALTAEQRTQVEAVRAEMAEEAQRIGEDVIQAERRLADLFRNDGAGVEGVDRLTEELALLRGRLQAVHLRAHLETHALLRPEQVAAYQRERGYAEG